MGVNSYMEEFAPPRANSFLSEYTPYERCLSAVKHVENHNKLFPFAKKAENHDDEPLYLEFEEGST